MRVSYQRFLSGSLRVSDKGLSFNKTTAIISSKKMFQKSSQASKGNHNVGLVIISSKQGFESKGLRLWVLSQTRARVSTRQSSDYLKQELDIQSS